jgi:ATP-dependent HslUV protease subunit HslV
MNPYMYNRWHAPRIHATTILGLRHKGKAALGGDGQVTFGETVLKHNATKVKKIYNDSVLVGFAGATADAFTLLDKFEARLEEFAGNLQRAAVELAKEWRTDRYLRRLEALLAVMDLDHAYMISGEGDVIEPEDGIIGVGSGASYAIAAARAYLDASKLDVKTIVERSLRVAASICIYTNQNIVVKEL